MINSKTIASVVALLLCAVPEWSAGPSLAQAVVGTLQFSLSHAPNPNHNVRVTGTHWVPGSPIVVHVLYFGLAAHRSLHVPTSGSFNLEIKGVQWCTKLTVKVRDQLGHRAVLQPSTSTGACSIPAPGTHIGIRVMSVHQTGQQQLTLDTRYLATEYVLHVGDVLYVYSPGASVPDFLPKVNSDYLEDVEHGTVPSCQSDAPCIFPPGSFWKYRALRAGTTFVGLSPACRQVTPPCGAPDRSTKVQIIP